MTFSTPGGLLLTDTDERYFTCAGTLLEVSTAPSDAHRGEDASVHSQSKDALDWRMCDDIGVASADEADDLRRIYAGEVHVSAETNTGQLGDVVEGLRILASGECKKEAVITVIGEGEFLSLAEQTDAVLQTGIEASGFI